jgi:hypothetical protein
MSGASAHFLVASTAAALFVESPRDALLGALATPVPALINGIVSNTPQVRTLNGTTWTSAATVTNIGSNPRWVVVRGRADDGEAVSAFADATNKLTASVGGDTSWSSGTLLSIDLTTTATRPFHVAYEQLSGRAIAAYRVGPATSVYYRVWTGTGWNTQTFAGTLGTAAPVFIRLVAKPASNEVTCIVLDSAADLTGMIWNGSLFANKVLMTGSAVRTDCECFDAAYEGISGRCVVAWGDAGTHIWNGTNWSTASAPPNLGGKTRTVRLASDPTSNKIISIAVDGQSNIDVAVWNGSAWGASTRWAGDATDIDRRDFDVAFEPAGTRALAVYTRSGSSGNVVYRVFNGSSWAAEAAGPAMGSTANIIKLEPGSTGQTIHIALERSSDGALIAMKWNGTAMVNSQVVAASIVGGSTYECFDSFTTTPRHRVATWSEVEPN